MSLGVFLNLAAFAATFALGVGGRSLWPGALWLLFVVAGVNTLPILLLESGDPRLDTLLPNSLMHLALFGLARLVRAGVMHGRA